MRQFASGLLALLLLLSVCAGCGSNDNPDNPNDPSNPIDSANDSDMTQDPAQDKGSILAELAEMDPAETVLELNGVSIPADIYLYWLMSTCNDLGYQIQAFSSYYGMYSEAIDENGNILWDQSVEGTPLKDMAREQAENSAMSYALMESTAAELGVALTSEDHAAVEDTLAAQKEQSGGEDAFFQNLYEQGLSLASYTRMISDSYLYQRLLDAAMDPSSTIYKAPSGDDAYVDHILISTVDSETNEPLSEEDAAAKREQAEDLLAQLQESDDLETLFTEFADTYGEDPGRAADSGYLINPDTNFVQEFKDAAFQLKPGEISGIVESDYGYHILLRKELTESQLETLADENLGSYLDGRMEEALPGAVRSDKLDGVDVGALYNGYVAKLQELHPETAADPNDGTAAGEEAGDSAQDGQDAAAGSGDGTAE